MINPKGWEKIEEAILKDLNRITQSDTMMMYKQREAFGEYVKVTTVHADDDKVSITTKHWDRYKDMEKLGDLFSSEPYENMKAYASVVTNTRQLTEDERLAFFEAYLEVSLPLPNGPGMFLLDGSDSELTFFADTFRTKLSLCWGGGLPTQYATLQPLIDVLSI